MSTPGLVLAVLLSCTVPVSGYGTAGSGSEFLLARTGRGQAATSRERKLDRRLDELLRSRDVATTTGAAVARGLRTNGHAIVDLPPQAAEAAAWLLAAQVAACPNASRLYARGSLFGSTAYHRTAQAVQTNVYDGKAYAPTPCLARTAGVRWRIEQLHGALRHEARRLLRALGLVQAHVEGLPSGAPWLAEALRVGAPGEPATAEEQFERVRYQVLLRSMAYAQEAAPDVVAVGEPEWTVQRPHQDATWLSLIVESSLGLFTSSRGRPAVLPEAALPGAAVWSLALGGSAARLLVLAGGRLAEASGGFYPASCHAVSQHVAGAGAQPGAAPAPRFSWILLYTSNCCDFYELPRLLSCGWGPNSTRQPYSVRGMASKDWCVDSHEDSCRIYRL